MEINSIWARRGIPTSPEIAAQIAEADRALAIAAGTADAGRLRQRQQILATAMRGLARKRGHADTGHSEAAAAAVRAAELADACRASTDPDELSRNMDAYADAQLEAIRLSNQQAADAPPATFSHAPRRATAMERSMNFHSSKHNDETLDNPTFRRAAMARALGNLYSPAVKLGDGTAEGEAAKQFAHMKPIAMMLECLAAQGHKLPRGTGPDKIVAAALHSTSDFPYLLADAANKILLPEYTTAAPTYRAWASPHTWSDFKSHKFMRLDAFPDLLQVNESGEVQRGTIGESREVATLGTFARILGVSRHALINDDLSAFARLAQAVGRGVARWENSLAYAVLNENSGLGPTMANGDTLFSTANANYTSSGTSVNTVAHLSVGRQAIRDQTTDGGEVLNLAPRTLLVGTANESAAEQVTTLIAATEPANVNPFASKLQLVVDAFVESYSWYMFADPAQNPAMVYGSLNGQTGPIISSRPGWDVEGVELKVLRDFCVAAIDPRPCYKNAGAAPS